MTLKLLRNCEDADRVPCGFWDYGSLAARVWQGIYRACSSDFNSGFHSSGILFDCDDLGDDVSLPVQTRSVKHHLEPGV